MQAHCCKRMKQVKSSHPSLSEMRIKSLSLRAVVAVAVKRKHQKVLNGN